MTTTDRLYDAIGPGITTGDDGSLRKWIDGPASLLREVDDVVRDEDSWGRQLDPARTTAPAWTGQWVGVRIPDSASDSEARNLIVTRPSFTRGSVPSLLAAALPFLTGSQHLELVERDTSAYHFTVRVYAEECPDLTALTAALTAAKPYGLQMSVVTISLSSFAVLEAQSAETYAVLEAQTSQTYSTLEA